MKYEGDFGRLKIKIVKAFICQAIQEFKEGMKFILFPEADSLLNPAYAYRKNYYKPKAGL